MLSYPRGAKQLVVVKIHKILSTPKFSICLFISSIFVINSSLLYIGSIITGVKFAVNMLLKHVF